ncbi:hypothetical protein [Sinimarinibacterium thermocellulolyticum]|uniref:Alpha/beta hydrolase family protein n=1 Tax=Sinimarinibacterium thermocellulolyticum TaxID=3170016 RepID=A0ABV2A8S2_9GAMM
MTTAALAVERHYAITRDAVPLVVARFVCHQPRRACLLLSDPALDRSFWMRGAPSAIEHLLGRGCEVFVAELRGCGLSAAAGAPTARRLHDHVALDVPALVAAIRRLSTPLPLYGVGHRRAATLALNAGGFDGVVGLDAAPLPGMAAGAGASVALLVAGADDARAQRDGRELAALFGARQGEVHTAASRRSGLIVDGEAARALWSKVVAWLDAAARPATPDLVDAGSG